MAEYVKEIPPTPPGTPQATQAEINALTAERAALYSLAGRRPPDKAERDRIRAISKNLLGLRDTLRRQLAEPRRIAHELMVWAEDERCREDLVV